MIAQKDGYRQVLENTKEIHTTTTLNQQNREYYSLRFSEVQKELSGMEADLGKSLISLLSALNILQNISAFFWPHKYPSSLCLYVQFQN